MDGNTGMNAGREPRGVTRRELTSALLAAALLVALAALVGGLLWYAVPGPPLVTLGSTADFPPRDAPYYLPREDVAVYVVNTGDDLLVLDAISPRTQCYLKWVPRKSRFEDPCCGGKFTLTGDYIEGAAIRTMDRYDYRVADGDLLVSPWWHVEGEVVDGRERTIRWNRAD